ncbi:MAG: hypothetical protein JXR56_02520 [Candidatus Cloacimonetes bacterium]|nr:hypothetical protein [Candidatus Cloacimonadota bacterium]
MKELLSNPFVQGLLLGVLMAIIVWINSLFRISAYKKDVKRQRDFLNTQMEINSKGNESIKKEIDELRRQNINLQTTVQTWQAKPTKTELRSLINYNRALEILFERERGFATYWQQALKEAEAEMSESDKGTIPLLKKLVSGSKGTMIDGL